jgi:signal transduction histidine kinase
MMPDLAHWLERHHELLVQAAVTELSQDEALRSQVVESVEMFFDALMRAVRLSSPAPLEAILSDWVAARSAPTEDEPTGGVVPALAIFKRVTWEQILRFASGEEIIDLLSATDEVYTQALIHLSQLEANALLADMRRQLDEAKAYVQYLDKRKADFVAVAAHELKTPLTLIEGYAEIIRQSPLSQNSQAIVLLDGIRGGIQRLREIIQDMIDVSLINLNLLKLHLQPVLLSSLFDIIESDVDAALEHRNIDFAIERDSMPRQATYADPQRLLQVFQKVVSNAIKYTPNGGKVTIVARELPGFTDIVVADTGIGIDPSNIQYIFDVFSSQGDVALHSSGKTKFKGAGPGLGLAIAKGIIEAHGGSIWAVSPGYNEQTCPGSTFHIMIPMYSSEAPSLSS